MTEWINKITLYINDLSGFIYGKKLFMKCWSYPVINPMFYVFPIKHQVFLNQDMPIHVSLTSVQE